MEHSKFMIFAKTAIKNLFTKPYTVAYPAQPANFPERMRGHIELQPENCICCGLCMRNCPPGAITVDRTAGTWSINRFDCIQCGSCAVSCPKKCLQIVPGYTAPDTGKHTETFSCPNRPAPPAKPAAPAASATGQPTNGTATESAAVSSDGKPVNNLDLCVFCTLCAKKCPQEAITVDRPNKTWTLDREKCISCGLCAENCPKKSITL